MKCHFKGSLHSFLFSKICLGRFKYFIYNIDRHTTSLLDIYIEFHTHNVKSCFLG